MMNAKRALIPTLILGWRVSFQRQILENNRIKSNIYWQSVRERTRSLFETMNFLSSTKDKNEINNMLQPNYRSLPAPRPIRPFLHLPPLTPMPHSPLLAMQLMMFRIRNSAQIFNENQNLHLRRNFAAGTYKSLVGDSYYFL